MRGNWQANTQSQNQGYDLAHPNICLIYEPLEHVKGPDLQIRSCRISMTQGSNGISKRIPSEGLVSGCSRSQKPHCSVYLQVKMYGLKGTKISMLRLFVRSFVLPFIFFFLLLMFVSGFDFSLFSFKFYFGVAGYKCRGWI